MTAEPILQEFRDQIDAIDDELIALLKKRSAIVSQVGDYKRKANKTQCFIRPGREAAMARLIVQQDAGVFPRPMLAAIWRLLIAGSTSIEQTLSISVCEHHGRQDFFWLAHEYFGPAGEISMVSHPSRVIPSVVEGQTLMGMIPMPDEDEHDCWRQLLGEGANHPQVFAIAPFLYEEPLPRALMVGDVEPEETGDDCSLLVVEASAEISRSRLQEVFASFGWQGHCLTQVASGNLDGMMYVFEVSHFLHRQHPMLHDIEQRLGEPAIRVCSIGAYARQLHIDEIER